MISVVIIDDDELYLKILSTSLDKNEFTVNTAQSGLRGFNVAKSVKPDIIFLDQIMPDMSGNEVLAMLKRDVKTKSIPVIIFSAYYNEQIKEEAVKIGAIDYLAKYNFDASNLSNIIRKYLKQDK